MRTLIDVGGFIVSGLGLDSVLRHVLEAACELTGARYAAIGVLNEQHDALERFVTRGVDDETVRLIGDRPRGRGVLGVLIGDPKPLRLRRVGEHPASYGFPAGHPLMDSFLGVPVFIRGRAWGNLYLAEKQGGAFAGNDEETIVVLARWAGIAVENARLYEIAERHRNDLERTVRALSATQMVAREVGSEFELERVLELAVDRARALVEARTIVVLLQDGDALTQAALAGTGRRTHDARIPLDGSSLGEMILEGRPRRINDLSAGLRTVADELGVDRAETALVVPLVHRGQPLGVLLAFDRGRPAGPFSEGDEHALSAFAEGAATAVVAARSVQQHRRRDALAAAEAERRRWAHELHDETLQALGGLRILLSAARRTGNPEALDTATGQALEQIEQEMTNLRALITDLRPAALDELGLSAALAALLERHRALNGLRIVDQLDIPERLVAAPELEPDIQTTVYRVVQEALTNVAKHANANTAIVSVRVADRALTAEVSDDGHGFTIGDGQHGGFGLTGMRERALLADGELTIDSSENGTTIIVSLPLDSRSSRSAQVQPPNR